MQTFGVNKAAQKGAGAPMNRVRGCNKIMCSMQGGRRGCRPHASVTAWEGWYKHDKKGVWRGRIRPASLGASKQLVRRQRFCSYKRRCLAPATAGGGTMGGLPPSANQCNRSAAALPGQAAG